MLGKVFLKELILKSFKEIIKKLRKKKIIELASGYGSLTKLIFTNNIKIVCVDIDNRISKFLSLKFKKKIFLINENLLNINFQHFGRIENIGNLPYYISSKIVFYVFIYKNIKNNFFMFHKKFKKVIIKINLFSIFKILFLKKDNFNKLKDSESIFLKLTPMSK